MIDFFKHQITDSKKIDNLLTKSIEYTELFGKKIDQSNRLGRQTDNCVKYNDCSESIDIVYNILKDSFKNIDNDFIFKSFYFNINPKYSFNHINVYENGYYSGILWLKCDDKSGKLKLFEEDSQCFVINKKNNTKEIKPKLGEIVIFPSNTPNLIEQNRSDSPLIFIRFNIIKKISND